MKRILFSTLAAAVTLAVAGFAVPAAAQGTAPAPKAAPAQPPVYGSQLMTPAERAEMQRKMRDAKSPEARTRLRDEHHAQMVERAQEQGVTLMGRGGDPQLYGQQLMTPAERTAHMEMMRAATTREERFKLRDEHRAEMQKRAQEKGITLPEPRRGMGGGMGPGKGGGMKGGPGGGGMMGGTGAGPGRAGNAPAAPPSATPGK